MSDFELISLDLETSNSEATTGTVLQVGCVRVIPVDGVSREFCRYIRHKELTISPEACRVHGIDMKTVDSQENIPMVDADKELRAWLCSGEKTPKRGRLIPMGMNVGTFDMDFVRKHLPKSAGIIGYRSLDLNALIFTVASIKGADFWDVKREAKQAGAGYADAKLEMHGPHNALWDAWSNLGVFYYLKNELGYSPDG